MSVYLDHNATTPLVPEAREAIVRALDVFGNPSSVHGPGRAAKAEVERARSDVAALVGGAPAGVVFTASATEALNTVLRGGFDHVVALASEHAAVLAPLEQSGLPHTLVPVQRNGLADLSALEARLSAVTGRTPSATDAPACSKMGRMDGAPRVLVAVQAANNESGVIQPISDVAEMCRSFGVELLCDAVQAFGKIPFDASTAGVDYAVISAHKLGGPKGIGALWAAPGRTLTALVCGGGQEKGQRGGTENVPGVAGFAAAARTAKAALEDNPFDAGVQASFEAELLAAAPGAFIVGKDAPRLPNTTLIAYPGARAETLVIALDLAGFAVSAGAACSSGKVAQSHVVKAMGFDDELSGATLRISTGRETTADELAAFCAAWSRAAAHQAAARRVA